MPLKHGPIEASSAKYPRITWQEFSMPLKHGPIEAIRSSTNTPSLGAVFHAPKAWPH